MKGVAVLFEDEEVLILDKPSGLAVQGGSGIGVSLDILLARERSPAPLLVHRLDRDTSGVILAAKTKAAAAKFSCLLRTGDWAAGTAVGLGKRYLALCSGLAPEKDRILGKLEVRGRRRTAETRCRRLAAGRLPVSGDGVPCSLLEVELGTGRTHQIRRHLAGRGFPILGDNKYGDFSLNKALLKTLGLRRLLLHAWTIVLPDRSGSRITAPLPKYFNSVLEQAGIAYTGLF